MHSPGRILLWHALCTFIGNAIAQPALDLEDDAFGDERLPTSHEDFLKPLMSKKAAPSAFKLQRPQTYYPEAFFLLLLLVYAINFWLGRRKNDAIVFDWATQFCKSGRLLDRNFSLVGPGYNDDGEELVMKNSHSEFHLWASGRRFCQGMLINLHLLSRQDLLALASYTFNPAEDTLVIEVSMHAASMPPTVLAVAAPKQLRALQRGCRDLDAYAHPIAPAALAPHLKRWPDGLHAVAESATVFGDLFPAAVVEEVFSSPAFEDQGQHFRWLHMSSEFGGDGGTPARPVLRMCCALPPQHRMHELNSLMEVMMAFIDIVGSYEMPGKARDKAERARADVAKLQEKERRKELTENVQKKKVARREAELEKVKRMTPAQRQKYEDRQKRIELGRAMKKRTVKV